MNDEKKDKQFMNSRSLDTLIRKWKDGTFGEIIDDWKWIFTYSARYKGAIVFYTLLGIFSTTMGLVTSVVSKYLIDIIVSKDMSRLSLLIGIAVGSVVFNLTFNSLINRISTRLSIYINNDIQADIFDKIMDAEWLEISKYRYGDILNRFNGDVSTVSSNAISWLPTIIIAIYNFIATFAVIWHYDKIMALLAFASAPFMLFMSRYLLKKQREFGQKVREMNSKLMTFEVETFYNMDTVKSFGIVEFYGRKMRDWQAKYRDISLEYNMFTIWTNIFLTIVGTIVGYAAFGYCLFRLWTGQITYGTMTMFLQQRSSLNSAFNKVVSIIPSFLNSSVSAHRIRELVELKREVHIPESSEMDKYVEDGFSVIMEGVDFAYVKGENADNVGVGVEKGSEKSSKVSEEASKEVLKDVSRDHSKDVIKSETAGTEKARVENEEIVERDPGDKRVITNSAFEAHPGEIVALVGPSGEGKTTMIRLILGLIRPDKGTASIVAANGKKIDMNADTRHLFAYVPQGNTILQGTISENMRMVKEDATDEEIIDALKIACAWDFVKKMPDTIDCTIGERGRGFSEGQAQRIAIARAIMRDAPVLLLDEATSALDVTTERKVLRNIIQQKPNKVCIVTTHRPSVLNMCQRVYRVMETHVTELSEEESSRMAIDF